MKIKRVSLVRLAIVAVTLISFNAYGQWAVNNSTSPPTVYLPDQTANVAIGTNTPDPLGRPPLARLTIAGAETFRFGPNPGRPPP